MSLPRSELSADPSLSHHQPHPTSGDDIDSGGFFGGMVVARTRRKKAMGSTLGSATLHEESIASLPIVKETSSIVSVPTNAPQAAPTEQKPFYMRVDLPMDELRDEEEDPKQAEVRKRLVRFYEEYNPAKLSRVDATLRLYLGREKELFENLVKKYGPEPCVLRASVLAGCIGSGSGGEARGGHSDVCSAFGFIADGPRNSANDATCSNKHIDNESAAPAAAAHGGFSFVEGFEPTSSGFDFLANAAPNSNEALCVLETAVDVSGEVHEAILSGGPTSNEEHNSKDLHDAVQSNAYDSEERETVWDRHRRELSEAHAAVLTARASIASGIESLCAAVSGRRSAAASLRAIAEGIECAVSREAFAEADALSAEHTRALAAVSAFDAAPLRLVASISASAEAAEAAVLSLAALLDRQRRELRDTSEEEERRARRSLGAAAFRLEARAECAAEAKARAERAEAHARAEVERLRTRRDTMGSRLAEQSRALQEARERVDGEIDALEQRRAALCEELKEVTTALEERRAARKDTDSQLRQIIADGAALEHDVDTQLRDEEQKLLDAAKDAAQWHSEQEDIAREEEAFAQRRDALLAELCGGGEKCDESAKRAEALRTQSTAELKAFVRAVAVAVVEQRAAGAGVLFEPTAPQQEEEEEAEEAEEAEEEKEAEEAEEDGEGAEEEDGENEREGNEEREREEREEDGEREEGEEDGDGDGDGDGELDPLASVRRLEDALRALGAREAKRTAQCASLAAEASDLRVRIAQLDAAKRSAAVGRRFAEAQQRADEARSAQLRLEEIDAVIRRTKDTEKKGAARQKALRERLAVARSKSAARVAAFLAAYRSAVEEAAKAEAPDLLRLTPLALSAPSDADELCRAQRRLAEVLREELDACEGKANE